ncbi:3-deoxy-D-manno-octulosonate 8-phosphate phosphatase KdsC [uncultured Roseburia sp.]|uniref:HAD-IIIA family hydrolase n=1 Tax=Brotonthovivens ammoniilytica TaxID=2981725 RepID=A0ABT2TF57_9FIRM|nr:HAD-IIIA family hydrolase [Brotonthovivens ammoniilytica]MCU6760820.1 HAD-IIIA family hydrolase [Brotonthovivens ammoniilytica]SCI10334.1 3-deoxy-D-manno-octulosonate 8-phosphate phosphatase KdsC [uncultured Roseburia sp.]
MNDLGKIKLVATDCDGVLTDGGMYYTERGDIMKKFNVIDGMGFIRLKEAGLKTAIITAENNPLLKKRAEKLKVDYLYTGSKNKLKVLKELSKLLEISMEEIAYIGDDFFDIPAIQLCGFGCAPCNALEKVCNVADYITIRKGGEGAFREMAERILERNQNVYSDNH